MADPLVSIAFDEASLGAIARMAEFSAVFEVTMGGAMVKIGDLIVKTAQDNTWSAFQNPTGQLEQAISATPNGPMEMDVTVNVPYARRLEEGFEGADILGRVFHNPAEPYLQPAVDAKGGEILVEMGMAAAEAWASLGPGL